MNRMNLFLSIAAIALVAGCKDGGASGSDGPDCVGAKCDDPDAQDSGADTAPLGKLDLPPVREDLGVVPSGACAASCAVVSECVGASEADCLLECTAYQAEAADHSAECSAAIDGLLACTAALDCTGYADYLAGQDDYPCAAEEQAAAAGCATSTDVPACDAFCTLAAECEEGDAAACVAACNETIAGADAVGDACGDAARAQFECVGALGDCEAYGAWALAEGDHPCAAADEALAVACTTTEEG